MVREGHNINPFSCLFNSAYATGTTLLTGPKFKNNSSANLDRPTDHSGTLKFLINESISVRSAKSLEASPICLPYQNNIGLLYIFQPITFYGPSYLLAS